MLKQNIENKQNVTFREKIQTTEGGRTTKEGLDKGLEVIESVRRRYDLV